MVNKMPRNAKSSKNKMPSNVKFYKENKVLINAESSTANTFEKSLILDNGYKVEVDEKSYLMFEKEDHYLFLVYLESIIFDLFKNIRFGKEEKEIRVFFHFTLLEKCLGNLKKILIESFYIENESINPFKKRFPYLWYMKKYRYRYKTDEYDIREDLNYWEDLDEMGEVFCPEIYILNYIGDEDGIVCYHNGYGEKFVGGRLVMAYPGEIIYKGKKEVSKEMKFFTELKMRRLQVFNKKLNELEVNIHYLMNIKEYKI